VAGNRKKRNDGQPLVTRRWKSMTGRDCEGRLVPDMTSTDGADAVATEDEAAEGISTEINIQLGEFTLKTSRLDILNDHFPLHKFKDYQSVFGDPHRPMQCAVVKRTTARHWYRLVGRRHDVLFWKADARVPPLGFVRPYESSTRHWAMECLEPFRETHLPGVKLYSAESVFGTVDGFVILRGYSTPTRGDLAEGPPLAKDKGKSVTGGGTSSPRDEEDGFKTLKEVVVFKNPAVVHIYNLLEHGRRYYRSLIFTSDTRYCLREMAAAVPYALPDAASTKHYASGSGLQATRPAPSLVITRNLEATTAGTQRYTPERFLYGLVPSALLDRYEFWQNPDDSLSGYARKGSGDHTAAYELWVELGKDAGAARIIRKAVMNPEEGDMVLMSVLHAKTGSCLADLRDYLVAIIP
jgi:hypothetical protein